MADDMSLKKHGSRRGGMPMSVKNLKTADALLDDVRRIKSERNKLERDWTLNQLFYLGKQYTFFNKRSNDFQALPTEDGEKPRYRVRLVDNHILPGVQQYVSMLTKTKPVIGASPNSAGSRDVNAAELAEHLFEYWWRDLGLSDKAKEALKFGALCGNGYWLITWNPNAGKPMTFTLDPEQGQPITNPRLLKLFEYRLEQAGVDIRQLQQTVMLGDIRVQSIHPENVFPDSNASAWDDVRYVYVRHTMPVDEVEAMYKMKVEPDTHAGINDPTRHLEPQVKPNAKEVFVGYFPPQPGKPNGEVIHFISKPDKILKKEKWPFPFQYLPLVQFPGIDVPGRVYDEALVSHARDIQKDINKTVSQIIEWKNLVTRPRMLAPVNSMTPRITNEPGKVYFYNPVGNQVPQWEQVPSLPGDIFQHLQNLKERMDRLFFTAAVTRGELPGARVDSGLLVDLMQETAIDQFAPIIDRYETSLARAGDIMAALAQQFYIEPRMLKIRGEGGSLEVRDFVRSDLQGGFSFFAEAGSGLPRTRAGRQARVMAMGEAGLLQPHQMMKFMDIADMKSVKRQMGAGEEHAKREHEKLLAGAPINPSAMQEAIAMIQAGLPNPRTQLPFQSQQEMEAFVIEAMLQPLPYENLGQHLEAHALWMMSPDFESLPPEVQQFAVQHYTLTQQALAEGQLPPEIPRVSLQFKGTLGPTVASKMLQQQGVEVSPEELQEPPLETWVTDSMDKPDMDDAGNDPFTEEERMFAMRSQLVDLELKAAQAEYNRALAASENRRKDEMNREKIKTEQERRKGMRATRRSGAAKTRG